MGRAPDLPDPDSYDKRHAHCDVLIVGGGPAGLSAALAAGQTGARVILADENGEFGGTLLSETAHLGGATTQDWADDAVAELSGMPEVRLLPRATVFGYYDHNHLGIVERVADHLAQPPAHTPAPAPVEGAREAGRAGDRIARAAAGLRRQRPARHHAGRRRPHLPQPLRRACRAARADLHQQ